MKLENAIQRSELSITIDLNLANEVDHNEFRDFIRENYDNIIRTELIRIKNNVKMLENMIDLNTAKSDVLCGKVYSAVRRLCDAQNDDLDALIERILNPIYDQFVFFTEKYHGRS